MRLRIALLGIAVALLLAAPSASHAGVDRTPATTLVKVGSFAKRTSAGAQSVTGVGFKPKLLILFGAARTSDGFDHGYQYGFGASDGTTSGAISGWSWDERGLLGADADRRQAPKAITFTRTIAGIEAEADLISFDSDGFTLNWTTNNAGPWIVNYMAVGGEGVQAKVSSFDANHGPAGLKSYTHVGFRPDALLLFGAPSTNGPLEASFGFADLFGHQFAMSVASQDTGVNPTNTARYQRTDRCFAALEPSSPAIYVRSEAACVSMNDSGFTLNWATDAGPGALISLAIRGVSARAGSLLEEIYSGDMSYSGIGFEPRGGLFLGFNQQAGSSVIDSNRFVMGAAGQDGGEASIWVSDQDNVVDDTRTQQATYDHECYFDANTSGRAMAYAAAASLKSWDADGFTLTWSVFSAAPAQLGYLVLGDAPTAVGGVAQAPESIDSVSDSMRRWLVVCAVAAAMAVVGISGWRVRRRRAR